MLYACTMLLLIIHYNFLYFVILKHCLFTGLNRKKDQTAEPHCMYCIFFTLILSCGCENNQEIIRIITFDSLNYLCSSWKLLNIQWNKSGLVFVRISFLEASLCICECVSCVLLDVWVGVTFSSYTCHPRCWDLNEVFVFL